MMPAFHFLISCGVLILSFGMFFSSNVDGSSAASVTFHLHEWNTKVSLQSSGPVISRKCQNSQDAFQHCSNSFSQLRHKNARRCHLKDPLFDRTSSLFNRKLHFIDDQKKFQSTSSSHHHPPIRLNKVFKATHSRRQSDLLIQERRVSVNGITILPNQVSNADGIGVKVIPFVDEVRLDGKIVEGWEELHGFSIPPDTSSRSNTASETQHQNTGGSSKESFLNDSVKPNTKYEYIKYWKPRGVICTTDRSIRGNIMDELEYDGYFPPHRVFPVGRLDKDTSGLILITSDGRLPNSVLRGQAKQPKTYQVLVDKRLHASDLEKLRNGVEITTEYKRDNQQSKTITAMTQSSIVEQTGIHSLQITIFEGRNRQIRKMMEALGYRVLRLHRVEFMGIGLPPLERAGEWCELNEEEMGLVDDLLFGDLQ